MGQIQTNYSGKIRKRMGQVQINYPQRTQVTFHLNYPHKLFTRLGQNKLLFTTTININALTLTNAYNQLLQINSLATFVHHNFSSQQIKAAFTLSSLLDLLLRTVCMPNKNNDDSRLHFYSTKFSQTNIFQKLGQTITATI